MKNLEEPFQFGQYDSSMEPTPHSPSYKAPPTPHSPGQFRLNRALSPAAGCRGRAGSQVLELDSWRWPGGGLWACLGVGEGWQTTLWIDLAQEGEKEAWR